MRTRRGMAMLLAIAAIALVGTALLTMAKLLHDESMRTQREQSQAQLRQVMLAAEPWVRQRLAGWEGDEATWKAPLPEALAGASVEVAVKRQAADRIEAAVTARMEGACAGERVEYVKAGQAWEAKTRKAD